MPDTSTTYVVIYDFDETRNGGDNGASENYYGYFSSKEDALKMFNSMVHGDTRFCNAKLCAIVENIPTPKQPEGEGA